MIFWYQGTFYSILLIITWTWSGAFPPGGWIGFTVHGYHFQYCLCTDTSFRIWININILKKQFHMGWQCTDTVGYPNKHPGPSENLLFWEGGGLPRLGKNRLIWELLSIFTTKYGFNFHQGVLIRGIGGWGGPFLTNNSKLGTKWKGPGAY